MGVGHFCPAAEGNRQEIRADSRTGSPVKAQACRTKRVCGSRDWYAAHGLWLFFGVFIGRGAILSPDETVEFGDKGVFRQGADNLVGNLAVFEKNKGWDAPDSVLSGADVVCAGVDLGDDRPPEKTARQSLYHRGQHPAGTAARRIEIEHNRQVGLADYLRNILVGKLDRCGVIGHGQSGLAFAAARLTVLFDGGHFVLGLTAWTCNNQAIHGMLSVT